MPAPFGRRATIDGTDRLILDLDLDQPRDAVWHAVATSDGLEPWIGVFDGDPASGEVEFRMTAESADAPPEHTMILECVAPERYDLQVGGPDGTAGWRMGVELADRAGGGTRLTFFHHADDVEGIDLMGPGWEYYLHRLKAHLDGADLSAIDFDEYVTNQGYYAELFGVEPSAMPPRGE